MADVKNIPVLCEELQAISEEMEWDYIRIEKKETDRVPVRGCLDFILRAENIPF